MADATYQPKVYKKQGGDEQVIASGGTQTIESGGTQTIESGATVTDASAKTESGTVSQTGIRTVSAAGRTRLTVTAGTTSAPGTIPAAGIATVDSSTGGAEVFIMPSAPAAGDVLHIACDTASSTGTCTVKAAAGVTFSSTAALRLLVFNTSNTSVTLFAVSATRYGVVGSHSTGIVPTAT